MHVLVVEDERKIAEALKLGLEAEGYQVMLASTGEEGCVVSIHDAPGGGALFRVMLPPPKQVH